MRGRTLHNAAIILDEAQNTTSMQMKMFLTRLGENSRMIVTGDPSQVDLPPGQVSGLAEATRLLADVEGIGHVGFKNEDVIRHELVARSSPPMTGWCRRRDLARRNDDARPQSFAQARRSISDLVVDCALWSACAAADATVRRAIEAAALTFGKSGASRDRC